MSAGWTLRATMVCRPRTIWAATTMGSTTICGWEACPPRPAMRISKLSSLAIRPPTRVLIRPAAKPGMLCSPNIPSTGNRSKRPSAIIALRTQPVLLGRLEDQMHRAVEAALAGQDVAGAEHHGHVPVVAAGVHRAVVPRPVRQSVALGQRQPVHVGAQPDRPAAAVRRAAPADGGHQAGAADAARDLQAHRRPARRPGSRSCGARRGRSRGSGAGRAASGGAGPPGPRALRSCCAGLVGRAGHSVHSWLLRDLSGGGSCPFSVGHEKSSVQRVVSTSTSGPAAGVPASHVMS